VHARAFRRPDAAADEIPVEVELVEQLRADDGWIPSLSLVAVDAGEVIGHVVCTRAYVRPGGQEVLGLGPLGVDPDRQRNGVGSSLVRMAIDAAGELDEPLIGLLGDPKYYGRFGFRPSTACGIEPPDPAWGEHFQVRPLAAYRADVTGTFEYSAPFRWLG
jgi:putative acetyltransferase